MGAVPEILPARPAPPRRSGGGGLSRLLEILLALVVALAAVISGYNLVDGSKILAVMPVVAVVAIGLGLLATTRFSGFVMMVLAVRPILDVVKLSNSTTGSSVGNTATARGIDPSSILGVLFLLAAALWLAGRVRDRTFIGGSRLQLAMASFIFACAISTLGSAQKQASALECLRISTVLMMFIVLNQLIRTRETMQRVIGACYVGLCGPVGYTLITMLLGSPDSEVKGSFTRITGPFNQSNTFARYLAFLIVFGVAIAPHVTKRYKWPFYALLGLSSLMMLLTLTRTGILGAVIGIVLLGWVQRRKSIAIGLIVVAMCALLVPGVGARFSSLTQDDATSTSPSGNSLIWRLNYWTEVLPLANENPVTGIGLNGTQYQTDAEKQPHNDFVRAYVETGMLGFLTYCAMLTALVAVGRRAFQRAVRGTFEHAVGAGSFAVCVTFVLSSVAANVMSNVVTLFSMVAFAACASYVSRTAGAHLTEQDRARTGAPVS